VRLLLAAVLLATATGACGRENMPTSVQEARAKHEARLMAQPGVVSVGIGRDADGTEVINDVHSFDVSATYGDGAIRLAYKDGKLDWP